MNGADTKTDEQLVSELQGSGAGDLRPFDQLVLRHQGRIVANCRYLTRSPNDAEDLAQEVFLKAYFALGRFEGRSTFKTWLQRIKINHCLNYLDKAKKREVVSLNEPTLAEREELQIQSDAERLAQASSERRRIASILDSLTDTLRVPLLLRDADGYSYQEIAEQLNSGLSAVKMRIKRAREEFRLRWQKAFGEEPEA